jgi:asparagine synthetase B (glutamine-hydrolysing)
MRNLELLVANPIARISEAGGVIRVSTDPEGRSGGVETAFRDGTSIEVEADDQGAVRLRAVRGIATSDELFYLVRRNGDFILTDNFRAALARLPLEERSVSDISIADHLLFRTTPGTNTYVSAVRRLGHGEELRYDRAGGISRESVAKLSAQSAATDLTEQLERIDDALNSVLTRLTGTPDLVNLLSGGIDSTLIHTYLGSETPSVSVRIGSPEFAFEVAYAEHASRILGTTHSFLEVNEADYFQRLEQCIDNLALPPHHLQTVLLDLAFQSGAGHFVTGQLADALFGLDSALLAHKAWSVRHVLRSPGVAALLTRMGAPVRSRVQRRAEAVERLLRSTNDPDSYGMRFAVYSDVDAVRELVGDTQVDERLQARFDYVRNRVQFSHAADDTLIRQLEVGHWIDFYCDDTVSLWRQLAIGRGRALHAPFATRTLAQSALEVPVRKRYLRGGRVKHLLKSLLRRRLRGYPANQPKGGSGLPFDRYYRTGPLRDAFERYGIPDFIPAGWKSRVRDEPSWLTWNALTFAIWYERVLQNPELPLPSLVCSRRWPSAAPAARTIV